MTDSIPLLAENLPQQRYLEAIFQSFIVTRNVRCYSYLLRDATLAAAEAFLLERPGRHLAIVLETSTNDVEAIREFYDSTVRRLSRTAPPDGRWHLALAIPRLDAWALEDPRIKEEYDQRIRQEIPPDATERFREQIENRNYLNLAVAMQRLVGSQTFDLDRLRQRSRQCRELCAFFQMSMRPEDSLAPASASDWF